MTDTLCLDVGSTWTKAALVASDGRLLGTAQHPTTPPEVLRGIDAVTEAVSDDTAGSVLACSSAGGGLRLAVVGQEPLVSAEAGHRVALSAGARVVHVAAGELTTTGIRELRATAPDLLLLVGGTDGGDDRCLLHNARRLASARVRTPIVLAGNAEARDTALGVLASTGRTVTATDNVLPDIGELVPGPARAAIRSAFLRHVIGGKGLSRGPRFGRLVTTVTPDAVLAGVETLAGDGDTVLVVDVGGATTDVYSVVSQDDPTGGHPLGAAGSAPQRRTVEGDLGMRWSAPGVLAAATAERLPVEPAGLAAAAERRCAEPDLVPVDDTERAIDLWLARTAAVLAVRRHIAAVGGLGSRGAGRVVLSGGVFRHASDADLAVVTDALRADPTLRPLLREAEVVVDRRYVLAPAGLLAGAGRVDAAVALLRSCLPRTGRGSAGPRPGGKPAATATAQSHSGSAE